MCQTICDATFSNVLGRLVQCEQKGWDRGRWIGIRTQRVKTAELCVSLAVKSLSMVMVLKCRLSQGLRAQNNTQDCYVFITVNFYLLQGIE